MLKTMRANWTSPRTDADTLWNFAPHDLTIAKTILGAIPEPKFATAEMHNGVVRGMLAILGEHPAFVFEISNRYADKRREIRLHGTHGVAVVEHENSPTVKVYPGDHLSLPDEIPCEEIPVSGPSALEAELQQFIEYIRGGPPPISPLSDGIEIARTIQTLRNLAGLP
jgi:predicted dehydrogenase